MKTHDFVSLENYLKVCLKSISATFVLKEVSEGVPCNHHGMQALKFKAVVLDGNMTHIFRVTVDECFSIEWKLKESYLSAN